MGSWPGVRRSYPTRDEKEYEDERLEPRDDAGTSVLLNDEKDPIQHASCLQDAGDREEGRHFVPGHSTVDAASERVRG